MVHTGCPLSEALQTPPLRAAGASAAARLSVRRAPKGGRGAPHAGEPFGWALHCSPAGCADLALARALAEGRKILSHARAPTAPWPQAATGPHLNPSPLVHPRRFTRLSAPQAPSAHASALALRGRAERRRV